MTYNEVIRVLRYFADSKQGILPHQISDHDVVEAVEQAIKILTELDPYRSLQSGETLINRIRNFM